MKEKGKVLCVGRCSLYNIQDKNGKWASESKRVICSYSMAPEFLNIESFMHDNPFNGWISNSIF